MTSRHQGAIRLGTRDDILREAAQQLAHAGAEGFALSRVAEAVGIRPASVFHHFPGGKAELERAIVVSITTTVAERLAEMTQDDRTLDPAATILHLAGMFWDLFEERPEIATLMLRQSSDPQFEEASHVREQATHILTQFAAFIRSAQANGDVAMFDVQLLFVPTSLFCIAYHGAPGLRRLVEEVVPSPLPPRETYLQVVRGMLRGAGMSDPDTTG